MTKQTLSGLTDTIQNDLKKYLFIISVFCTCKKKRKYKDIFTRPQDKTDIKALILIFFFRLLMRECMMRCRVGQQSQDGGETVQLLFDVFGQLLVLLIPVNKTENIEIHSDSRALVHTALQRF